jgi:hypothetical protein
MPDTAFEWQTLALVEPPGWPVHEPELSAEFTDPSDSRYLVRDVLYDLDGAVPGDGTDWARYVVHEGPEADYVYVNQTRDIPSGPVTPAFVADYSVAFTSTTLPKTHRVQVASRNDLPVELFPIIGAGMVHLPTLAIFDPSLGDAARRLAVRVTPQDSDVGVATQVGLAGVSDPARGAYYWGETIAVADTDRDIPLGALDGPDAPETGWTAHAERTAALVGLTVTYGAPDSATRPRPLQADVELAITVAGDCPPAGDRFRLCLSDAAAAALSLDPDDAILFTGEVTDPTIDPRRGVHRVTAAGVLGRNFRRTIAALGWPVQTDAARAERIMDRADIEIGEIADGTVDLAAPEQDDTAGALLDRVTGSTGGAVVEQPAGPVDYLGPDHRRGSTVTLTLDASNIDNALTWSQHVDDILNEVEVAYSGGTVLVQDPASVDTRGVYPGRVGTDLLTASEAYSLGQLVVGRRAEPVWQLPNLEVDLMHAVDDELRGQILTLRHGDLIEVTDIPAPHAYTGDVKLYVEGWSTTVTRPWQGRPWRWRHTLFVSDRTLSGVSIRWMDVDPDLAWADVDPTLTWFGVATIIDDEDLLGEPGSGDLVYDGGGPFTIAWDTVIDAGDPDDTPTTTYDGGTP